MIAGLGEIGDIQQLYVDHAGAAIDSPERLRNDSYFCPEGKPGQFLVFGKARQAGHARPASDVMPCHAVGADSISARTASPLMPDKYIYRMR